MTYPTKITPNPRPLFYFKKRKSGSYFGINEQADVHLHEQVTNVLNTIYPDTAIRILDIACGEGALSLRVRNTRYAMKLADEIIDVDIVDPKSENPCTYYQIDLNDEEQFKSLVELYPNYFDVILGIETIEHLDNPKMYLHYLNQMLYEDGHIFISTPSINNPMARRIFYKKGRLEQFSEKDLEYGHVNVILPHLLMKMASDLKLNLVAEYPLGLYPKFWLYPDLRSLYITFCNILMIRSKGYWSKLYIFKKGG